MARPKNFSEIGHVLRMARVHANMTLREIETTTGLNSGLLSQIETGHIQNPSFSTVVLIAHAIGFPLQHLADKVTDKLPGRSRRRRRDAGIARAA